MDGEEIKAVGWQAIETALKVLYPEQEPKHYGTLLSYELGGDDPLRGISVYKRLAPVPHWHFVTYGFTELFEKQSETLETSGFGFELTFRLLCSENDEEPPAWALNFLQNLARYVFDSGNVFRSGHYLNANGPIAVDEATQIGSIAFIHDPELAPLQTPNGEMEFLQIVGLTGDEEFSLKRWSTLKALDVFRKFLPLYVTDLHRSSLLENPEVREAIAAGAQEDGSSMGRVFVDRLDFVTARLPSGTVHTLILGALQVPELLTLLPLRLPFGRDFSLVGHEMTVWFAFSERCSVAETDDGIGIYLNNEALNELGVTLKAEAGHYTLENFKGLVFEVEQTQLRDNAGNILETIG